MKAVRLLAVLVVSASALPYASAQSFGGAGIDPGDNNPAGGTSTVTVSGFPSLTDTRIEVDVTWTTAHTFVGDVTLTLRGPNNATVDLLRRVGSQAVANDGFNSNLIGTYTFRDLAPTRVVDVAAQQLGDTAFNIPAGNYRATTNLFNGNGDPTYTGEAPQTLDTSFGTVGDGDWVLFYSDSNLGEYAAINGWVLRFVPVPEPASVLAISAGIVSLAGFARRRFRREPVLA